MPALLRSLTLLLLATPALAQQAAAPKPRISPAQAKELFRSVDTILRFDAHDTGLPIHSKVKRRLLTRAEIVAYLKQKMDEDKDTARIERSALVLEKFGLLPRGFALRPFLLDLLGEQVAGFYDEKTKTVNLLDWVDAETQKPVLAHELTHALQDQYQTARGISLDKWENVGPEGTARNVAEDREHLRTDEDDTAREAVLEGQAMVAYYDWGLSGKGQSLRTLPDIGPQQLGDPATAADSPVLAKAPLVLRDSMLFPYQEGLEFEQHLLKHGGTQHAFADVLNRPPGTSYEIMHPQFYEEAGQPPLLAMPDLHPLLDADWAPYDVGVMGALDVRMLGEVLGDKGEGADAALAWDGGMYYCAQRRDATDKNSAASLALVYLSRWKSPAAAAQFAKVYRASLAHRYKTVQADPANTDGHSLFTTEEGPVLVMQGGGYVFLSHSLPVETAEKVMALMLDAQTTKTASVLPAQELSAPLRGWFAKQGSMRATLNRRLY